ncbi:MAG: pitrilysin family protein [Bacteroidales bacterium]
MKKKIKHFMLGLTALILFLPQSLILGQKADNKISVKYEQFKLANGLDVILHVDKSDPIVAVAIQFHVGSNREVKGRTGFAHLFEHMMFQRSENVGEDQFFKLIQNAGGELNGGTNFDGTVYYEIVPRNALELALWLESDRMGYMINTVTKAAFANQQNVVQNEKRQRVDNNPYGHTGYVLNKALYPEGHPYNWQVIGEMEDLFNATVEDVKAFHQQYYVPNNATLVLAGDFDPKAARVLIEKYFGEIPKGKEVVDMKPMPVQLQETKKLYHEDNFAKAAQLTMVWPTVEQFSNDGYALDILAQLLSSGKKAPLYRVIEKEKKLASRPVAYNSSMELAGAFNVRVTANSGISLDEIEKGVFESFDLFEKEGFTDKDLERIKASLETDYYNNISSVFNKAYQLAYYNEYIGDPSYIEKEIDKIRAVTVSDVKRVYEKYIKGKPFVETSFVPKGQLNLMVANSVKANVVEENIKNATEVKQDVVDNEEIIKTKTKLDRSKMPALGPDPAINLPKIWNSTLANGLKVYGIEQMELPLVQFNIVVDGGMMLEDKNKIGVANLVAELFKQGTKDKTPLQLEEELEMLGASVYVSSTKEGINISVNTLARNYQKTLDLVQEMILKPRWDAEEFELAKSKIINILQRNQANPNYLSSLNFNKLLYGESSILGFDKMGTVASVQSITLDDLKAYYEKNFSPSVASFMVAGSIKKDLVLKSLQALAKEWTKKEVKIPEFKDFPAVDKSKIYFVDVPGAKQSVIRIGYLSLSRLNSDYYPAVVMNEKLGGSFSGMVNLVLREEKGFTYGAYTGFTPYKFNGPFWASSSVRSNSTFESVQIFKDIMEKYRQGISAEDLEFTKNTLLKSNALRFETLGSLIGMLNEISSYNLPFDYVKKEEGIVKSMTLDSHKQLAQKYIVPDKMVYLVVGDAATQLEPLKNLGFGDPILIKNQ